MIHLGSVVSIIDNSGGVLGKCIRIYEKRKKGIIGSLLMVTLKSVKSNKKVQKGQLFKSLVVRSKDKFFFLGGHFGRFESSAIILLKSNSDIVCTRVHGPVSNDLRKFGFTKVLALSSYVY